MLVIKKIFNKSLIHGIIAVMLFTMLFPMQLNAAASLKTGDYVQFGSYHNEPILWRVVNTDNNGPQLLSVNILCLKAFDVMGSYHTGSVRKSWGSNYWKGSNIRQWLNSSEIKIKWLQNAPNKKNLNNSSDAYADEKGFLADGNFTADERKAIKTVKRHVLLAKIDKKKAEGGNMWHVSEGHIGEVVQNYDKAYYHTVTDKVFFLNVKEVEKYLYDREWEFRAFPTEELVMNAHFRSYELSTLQFWWYWLDTPQTQCENLVRYVNSLGYLLEGTASSSYGGVRPSLYLDMQSINFKSGSGSESDPYVVDRGKATVQQKAIIPSIKITINGKLFTPNPAPFMRDSTVLVPFNAIFEALGAKVYWDADNLMAVGGVGKTYITLSPDNPQAFISKIKPGFESEVNILEGINLSNFGQYVENNTLINLDVPPTVKNGQIMVPVRFVAESLGGKAVWDDKNKTFIITTP